MLLLPPRSTLFPYTTLFRSMLDSLLAFQSDNDGLGSQSLRTAGNHQCLLVMNMSAVATPRSEEHTSELQSHSDLVCRLLLEIKKRAHDHPDDRVPPSGPSHT